MDLSIIIVNWNSAEYCLACISSIYAVPFRGTFEIIVIDNASYDGCDRILAKNYPAVQFIQGNVNAGFAQANNEAFTHSSGDILCFLNPDTNIQTNALQKLYDSLISLETAGAVGALLRNGDGSIQTSCVLPFPTLLNQALDMEWLRKRFPMARIFGARAAFSKTKLPQSVEAISGACIMMRSKTFAEIGMFSPEYFMYAEDIDLCHKIRLTGKNIFFINEAEIIHYGGGSSKNHKSSIPSAILMRESNYKMLLKFKGFTYALLYRLSLAGMGIIRLSGLLLFLLPALIKGNGRNIIGIMRRWWHLLLWAIGLSQLSQVMKPVAAEV